MARLDLRKLYPGIYCKRKRLAAGGVAVYWYHRATGRRLNADGGPGTSKFHDVYLDAERIEPKDTGTVGQLIREFTGSPKFEKLRTSTKREYIRMLRDIEAHFGTMPNKALASPKVRGEFINYQEEIGRDRPREADNRLTVLSAVLAYAARKGKISDNPLRGFERLYHANRSEHIWTEADIKRFMKEAPVELQRAMILALHTGQRYGDLIRLRWSDYDGAALSLQQSKTSVRVDVKCTEALRRMLNQTERSGLHILTRADGRPWFTERNDKALSKAWRAHATAAGVSGLTFHDLRGTAVTLLSEAGATPQQVAAITGHTMQSVYRVLERYLARTPALAAAAILAFENAPSTKFANRLRTVGDNTE